LRLALSKGPNRVGVSPTHLRTETDPVSETLCSIVLLEYQRMDEVQKLSKSKQLSSVSVQHC
jgi:hypothetical protein